MKRKGEVDFFHLLVLAAMFVGMVCGVVSGISGCERAPETVPCKCAKCSAQCCEAHE